MSVLTTSRLTLILLAASLPAYASYPATVSLSELLGEANSVALVEIQEGKTLGTDAEPCGARYKARVVEGMKNVEAGRSIELGFYSHLKVGARYLMFLETSPTNADAYLSRSGLDGDRAANLFRKCGQLWAPTTIMHFGSGALEVFEDSRDYRNRALWTVQIRPYVRAPIATRTSVVDGQKRWMYSDLVDRMQGKK